MTSHIWQYGGINPNNCWHLLSVLRISPTISLHFLHYFEKENSYTRWRLNSKIKIGSQPQRCYHLMSSPISKWYPPVLQKGEMAPLQGMSRNDSTIGSCPALAKASLVSSVLENSGWAIFWQPISYLHQDSEGNMRRSHQALFTHFSPKTLHLTFFLPLTLYAELVSWSVIPQSVVCMTLSASE